MLNKAQLIGFTGAEAEIRTTAGGKKVAVLSVATSRYTKKGGDRKDYTTWHTVRDLEPSRRSSGSKDGRCRRGRRCSSKARSATTATPTRAARERFFSRVVVDPRPSTS